MIHELGAAANRFTVHMEGTEEPVVLGPMFNDWRFGVPGGVVLANLPGGWAGIDIEFFQDRLVFEDVLRTVTSLEAGDVEAGLPPPPSPKTLWDKWPLILGYGLLILYLIIVFTLAWTQFAGDGGLALHFVHLILGGILVWRWEPSVSVPFLALNFVAFVLYLWAKGRRPDDSNFGDLVAWAVYSVACLGMLTLALRDKDYRSYARWTGPESIQLYLNADDRGAVELVDAEGDVLATLELGLDRRVRTLVAWPGEVDPAGLRLAASETRLDLGDRPTEE